MAVYKAREMSRGRLVDQEREKRKLSNFYWILNSQWKINKSEEKKLRVFRFRLSFIFMRLNKRQLTLSSPWLTPLSLAKIISEMIHLQSTHEKHGSRGMKTREINTNCLREQDLWRGRDKINALQRLVVEIGNESMGEWSKEKERERARENRKWDADTWTVSFSREQNEDVSRYENRTVGWARARDSLKGNRLAYAKTRKI